VVVLADIFTQQLALSAWRVGMVGSRLMTFFDGMRDFNQLARRKAKQAQGKKDANDPKGPEPCHFLKTS